MSAYLPKSVEKVIEEFEKLPGVGPKSAARMAYHYLRASQGEARRLANSLLEMEANVKNCTLCYNVAESEICDICNGKLRDQAKLCVVEEPLDVVAFEKSAIYNGLYFVLGGVISPAEGIGPEELRFHELKKRVVQLMQLTYSTAGDGSHNQENEAQTSPLTDLPESQASVPTSKLEVIVATNPSLEGEATSNYIMDLLGEYIKTEQITISRLAMGLPTGADLEYADRLTLKRALEGRRGA